MREKCIPPTVLKIDEESSNRSSHDKTPAPTTLNQFYDFSKIFDGAVVSSESL